MFVTLYKTGEVPFWQPRSQGPFSTSRKDPGYFLEVERGPWERGCPFGCLVQMVFTLRQRMKNLSLQTCVVVRTSNMKISRCPLADYVKNCIKKRAARAARLFFLIQPIKSLICGVVVVVAVVIS